jgi:hypothetical protein
MESNAQRVMEVVLIPRNPSLSPSSLISLTNLLGYWRVEVQNSWIVESFWGVLSSPLSHSPSYKGVATHLGAPFYNFYIWAYFQKPQVKDCLF